MNSSANNPSKHLVFPWRGLLAILVVALVGRLLLLASSAVSFHSDEAVVGLMARHILQGERPVFFYGQAYMGSLDSWLIAIGFKLLGESVLTIRTVEAALYLGTVATGWLAAWKLSGRAVVANVAGLALAAPSVMVTTYTAATLGGYNETMLLGNLLLILGYDISHDHAKSVWRWALLGLCAGVGWWTNGLIIAFAAPVGLLILYRLVWKNGTAPSPSPHPKSLSHASEERVLDSFSPPLPDSGTPAFWRGGWGVRGARPFLLILVALACFFVGSAPWWVFDFAHNHAALAFYLPSVASAEFAGNTIASLPLDQRLFGLFFLGLPTLVGLRFPWRPDFFLAPVGAVVLLLYGLAIYRLAAKRASSLPPDARGLILTMTGLFCLIFLASKFSLDPTGRYFLPLVLPLGIALGLLVDDLRRSRKRIWPLVAAVVIGYAAAGQINAIATNPPGITTQFNPVTHIPNDFDGQLIAFLEDHHLYNGYTDYWISFRLAFLSGERLQYSALLPYKANLEYTPADERIPAYRQAADSAERVAYITANVPEVDARLEAIFADRGITYQDAWVGPFHIYYDFSPTAPRPPL